MIFPVNQDGTVGAVVSCAGRFDPVEIFRI